jgi:hypothetical protein
MLGLPQAVGKYNSVEPEVVVNEMTWNIGYDLDRMEQIHVSAAGLILKHGSNSRSDETSSEIEQLLLDATACVPSTWWSQSIDLMKIDDHTANPLPVILGIMAKFTHYHLIIRLHLPCLLGDSADGSDNEYQKLAVADASRFILDLYVEFRSKSLGSAYCRGIDYIAFVAATALCIVHMGARQLVSANTATSALQSLRYQACADRGRIERTQSTLKELDVWGDDPISRRICDVLASLLETDAKSFRGDSSENYAFVMHGEEADDRGFSGTVDACGGLRIHIPHFGAIKIAPSTSFECVALEAGHHRLPASPAKYGEMCLDQILGDTTLDGVDFALFGSLGVDWNFHGLDEQA